MTFGSAQVSGESTPTTLPDIDDFSNRTIALHSITAYSDAQYEGAWGEASSGRTWRFTNGNADDLFGVSDGLGHWEGDFIFGGGFGAWGAQLIDWDVGKYWYPVEIADAGSLYVRFRTNTVGSDTFHLEDTEVRLLHFNGHAGGGAGASWQLDIRMSQANGSVQLQGVGGFETVAKTDWIANAWYTIEVKQAGAGAQARIWADELESVPAFIVSAPINTASFPWGHDVNAGAELDWSAPDGTLFATGIWTLDTDRIWFVPANPVEPAVFLDDFERDVLVGLGINDEALRYVAFVNSIDGDPWLAQYVSGSEAVHPFTPTQTDSYAYLHSAITGLSPALARNSFIFATRFKQDGVTVPGGSDFLRFDWTGDGFVSNIHIGLDLASGVNPTAQAALTVRDGVIGGFAIDRTAAIPDVVAGEWYALTLDYLAGDHARLKFWRESLGEPDGWLVDITSSAVPDNTQCSLFEWFSSTNTGTPPGHPTFTRRYDYIQIV